MKEPLGLKFKGVNVVVLDREGYCGGCLRGGVHYWFSGRCP